MDSSDGLVTNIIGNNSDTRADIAEISRNLIYLGIVVFVCLITLLLKCEFPMDTK